MSKQPAYSTLKRKYGTFEKLDGAFEFERRPSDDFLELEYNCGQNSPEILQANEERRLITLVEGDTGALFYAVGYCRVNRLAYYRTVKPMPEALYTSGMTVRA